jgi:aryl-alcohol dehydrogenase-like predicted oxidoreductase
MQFRNFGDTNNRVSEISFGAGDNAGVMVRGSSRAQLEIIEKALEAGVSLFDTSGRYGGGASEVNLGRVLEDLSADQAQIMSKVFIEPSDFERIRESVSESVQRSRSRLRRERIDFLLLHNPVRSQPHPVIPRVVGISADQVLNEVLPALVDAKKSGQVRFIGLACDDAEVSLIEPLLSTGAFDVVNVSYNMLNPSAGMLVDGIADFENYRGLLCLAEKYGIGVAAVRPLAGGALAEHVLKDGVTGIHPLSQGYFRKLSAIHEAAIASAKLFTFLERPGEQSLSQAAYKFILREKRVSTVIGGFSEPSQIDDVISGLTRALSPQEVREIDEVLSRGFGPERAAKNKA